MFLNRYRDLDGRDSVVVDNIRLWKLYIYEWRSVNVDTISISRVVNVMQTYFNLKIKHAISNSINKPNSNYSKLSGHYVVFTNTSIITDFLLILVALKI